MSNKFSPQLKRVIGEIKAKLEEENIGGIIVLHTPGHAEYLMQITPKYSCLQFSDTGELRLASLKSNHNGDIKKQKIEQANTANMLAMLAEVTEFVHEQLSYASRQVDEATGAEHDKSVHTSQN